MAADPLTTTRRTLLGAAVSLPVLSLPRPIRAVPVEAATFARRLARYRRLAQRTREAAESGFFRIANDRYNRERAEVETRYGTWEAAAATYEGRKLRRDVFARVAAAEETFYTRCTAPMERAAILLCLTPAPNLPALLAKIRAMQAHELQELDMLPKPALELLAEDVLQLLHSR